MDAARSDPEFLYQVLERTIAAGATTIIPNTVGYDSTEFGDLIRELKSPMYKAIISVHGHNDLGGCC